MSFTDAERAYLSTQRLGRVGTASALGVPDVAPVTYQLDGDEIVIRGRDNPATLKWRNVVANGRAAFVVDDLETVDPWVPRGVKLRGPARTDEVDGRPVIRIAAETVWSWGINADAEKYFANMIEKRTT